MARPVFIMVCDQPEMIENAKKHWEGQDVQFLVYSPYQWKEGLESNFFRSQLVQGLPALTTGHAPVNYGGASNVLPFPQPTSTDTKVQKMEDIEAHAIEAAIHQYKGNLTEAAKALGIGRATLYRKVKQYHIDPSAARKRKMAA